MAHLPLRPMFSLLLTLLPTLAFQKLQKQQASLKDNIFFHSSNTSGCLKRESLHLPKEY